MSLIASHFIYVVLTFVAGMVAGWASYWSMQRMRRRIAESVQQTSTNLHVKENIKD